MPHWTKFQRVDYRSNNSNIKCNNICGNFNILIKKRKKEKGKKSSNFNILPIRKGLTPIMLTAQTVGQYFNNEFLNTNIKFSLFSNTKAAFFSS